MFTQDTLLYWLENDLLCFAISVLIAGILIPKIILIAFRRNLFDEIDERKIHRGVVPRLGGIAFFPAFLFSLTLVVALNLRLGSAPMIDAIGGAFVPIYFEICAIILLYLVGIADDLIGVRYMAKFVVQIVCAILLACSGMYIDNLYGILWLNELPDVLAWLFSILVTVYVVNAINLIDGIDGLASGLSSIALIFYAVVFFNGGEFIYSLLAVASAGTLFPFFYYNVFGDVTKQKKIFMGDTGSLTIGIMLAFLTIAVFNIPEDAVSSGSNIFIMAVSPLILPCFDVARVFLHRVRHGRNPFLPDKCHIHHKFLALGLLQWQALVSIVAFDMLFVIINVLMSRVMQPTLIILGDVLLWFALQCFAHKDYKSKGAPSGQSFI